MSGQSLLWHPAMPNCDNDGSLLQRMRDTAALGLANVHPHMGVWRYSALHFTNHFVMLYLSLFREGHRMVHRTHRHRPEGPCHFSLMSLSATRRLLLAAAPLGVLWLAVSWAAGWWG